MIAPDGFTFCGSLGRVLPALPPSDLTIIGTTVISLRLLVMGVLLARKAAGIRALRV